MEVCVDSGDPQEFATLVIAESYGLRKINLSDNLSISLSLSLSIYLYIKLVSLFVECNSMPIDLAEVNIQGIQEIISTKKGFGKSVTPW